jgi:hypothetical protein
MASTVITITHDSSTADMQETKIDHSDRYMRSAYLSDYFSSLARGTREGSIDVQIAEGSAVAASGTITFSDTGAADDTILINGVTFTAKASGATGNEWNVGASATLSAQAFKAAVNASASALVSQHVTASGSAAVITITAIQKGVSGNAITIAEGVDSSSDMAVSGARLTGGANATANSVSYGR